MPKPQSSAGLLLYRGRGDALQVLLVHPGGPFWANRDAGAWTIPKGGIHAEEDPLDAARREFTEETGVIANGPFTALTPIRQRSGKIVRAWAAEGDCDARAITSNTFEMEWPPRSGRVGTFPEVDRAQWFTIAAAAAKILPAQAPLLHELQSLLRKHG